jgi:MFS family permease
LSCGVKFSPFLPGLFLGRLLGGFATAILFSSFEAWLVSSAHSINMPSSELGKLLGRLTLVSSVAAVASGFVADGVVSWTGSFASPFGVSGACLVAAGGVLLPLWKENYGGNANDAAEGRSSLREAVAVVEEGEWRI